MAHNCSRCGGAIQDPPRANAKYIRAPDFAETEQVEVVEALTHTDKTRAVRDRLVAEEGLDEDEATRIVATDNSAYLRTDARTHYIREEDLGTKEIDEPRPPESDEETVLTRRAVKDREVVKTGLVHPECVEDGDTVIW